MLLPYRPCVVAVIQNAEGLCLVGERSGVPGAWQFPQGGVEEGEPDETAFFRELLEEIGSGDVEILRRSLKPIVYNFPADLPGQLRRHYAGQSQTWFLARFKSGAGPDLAKADGEFGAIAWMPARTVVEGIIAWKRRAYEQGLDELNVSWR